MNGNERVVTHSFKTLQGCGPAIKALAFGSGLYCTTMTLLAVLGLIATLLFPYL